MHRVLLTNYLFICLFIMKINTEVHNLIKETKDI